MSNNQEQTQCEKPCGENHCDTNGCVNRKRHLVKEHKLDDTLRANAAITKLREEAIKKHPFSLLRRDNFVDDITSDVSREYWQAQQQPNKPHLQPESDAVEFAEWLLDNVDIDNDSVNTAWWRKQVHRTSKELYAEFKSQS